MLRFVYALIAALLVASVSMPAMAMTPNQQKFATCAHGWAAYKQANNVSGRAAYRAYMSGCLHGSLPTPTPQPTPTPAPSLHR